jgi:hypothetical protein
MTTLLNNLGTAAGAVGAIICAGAGGARLGGSFYLANFEATSLFMVGTGLMVFACVLKLEALSRQ